MVDAPRGDGSELADCFRQTEGLDREPRWRRIGEVAKGSRRRPSGGHTLVSEFENADRSESESRDELPTPPDLKLSDELHRRRRWQAYFEDCLQSESPGWLVSLVLHLICFLLITTLSVPMVKGRRGGSGSIALTLGFADQTQESKGQQITLEPSEPETTPTPAESKADEPTPPVQDPSDATERPSPQPAPADSSPAAPRSGTQPQRQSSGAMQRAASSSDEGAIRVSPYAAILNRHRTFATTAAPSVQVAQAIQPLTEIPLDPQQQSLDQIVDDFIAYDIGQLRGSAGQVARNRFAELGPESIPALVRGLNKAAGINASCPVGVIAGKLMSTLRAATDPSMRDFAIQNIGVGVSESAPHYQRLLAFRKHWLQAPETPPQVAAIIQRLEVRQEGELMELMLALSDAPSDTVVASLNSGDEYLAAAATLAIIQGGQVWTPEQRGQLRSAVIQFRSFTSNAQLRSLAQDAEQRLRPGR